MTALVRRLVSLLVLVAAPCAVAALAPQGDPVAERAMGHPDLFVKSVHLPADLLPAPLAAKLGPQLSSLGVRGDLAGYDVRAGRWGTLIARTPLVPGPGVGNTLTWGALGLLAPSSDAAYKDAVWRALKTYLAANRAVLGIDAAELGAPSIGAYEKNRLVHVYADRVVNGVPVRDSYLRATLVAGNLVLYGTRNWGTIDVSTTPSVGADAARGVLGTHLAGFTAEWGTPQLAIVPLSSGESALSYRLAWAIGARVSGSQGSWEGLVDAQSGELLAFYDRNSYIDQKKVVGGVFPVSNDGNATGGVPDGTEQPGYPMSRAYVLKGTTQYTANSEGLVTVPGTGDYKTELKGPFVRIQDGCGAASEITSCDTLDLGSGPGTDCARPANHSLGDTHSGRTGFYELNRLIDQAKSWVGPAASNTVPTAGWLTMQLPANMNINNACNAFFSPADTAAPTTGSVNFYRKGILGSNSCRNTGEIPAVFDHEWGHGLDTYDDSKGVSLPGEAYADMSAILRLNQSCVARGFYLDNAFGGVCTGNGDVCTECSGVREADWLKRFSRMPHDLAWVLDQNPSVPGNCGALIAPPTPFNAGPCGRGTHCEGNIISEALWDLLKRDLPCQGRGWEAFEGGPVAGGRCKGGPTTVDENSALVLGTRLYYLGGPGVKLGYQCDPRVGGCNADSWYFNFLVADDDDGSLENGTPHMVAINDAFRRHGIACRAPLPSSAGCLATPAPTARPAVTASAGPRSATITWTAVANAAEYWVLRTEGVHGCDFGKTRVARVPASAARTFTQTDLLEGMSYYYSVVPVGGVAALGIAADACTGPVSDCAVAVPLPPSQAPAECAAPANRAPIAVDDVASVPSNHPNRVDVLSNDTDADFDALSLVAVTAPAHGAVLANANGTVTYSPEPGYAGSDGFDYTVSDGNGGSDSGHVTLTVGGEPCGSGFTVVTDASGDATGNQAFYDVQSASVAQLPDGKVGFLLKMASLSTVPPDSTWPISFTAADGSQRFVKMATSPVNVTFAYGSGAPSGAGTPADPSSSYSADGTIRIVVPPAAAGNPQVGQELKFFLTRIAVEAPNVGTLTPDNMPQSLVPGGHFEFVTCN